MMKLRAVGLWAVALTLSLAPAAKADVLFESATPLLSGPWHSSISGVQTNTAFFSGFTFQVTSPVKVTGVGGDFGIGFPVGNNQIFGAIVPVSGPLVPPNPPDLSSNVLGETLITLPAQFTTGDVSAALSLDLSPGFYAVLFGSGKFGATGEATAVEFQDGSPTNSPVNGVITYAIRQPDGQLFPQAPGARYFVEGTVQGTAVPEPSAVLLFGTGLVTLGTTFRKARRRSLT